jgi:hypothetical protein
MFPLCDLHGYVDLISLTCCFASRRSDLGLFLFVILGNFLFSMLRNPSRTAIFEPCLLGSAPASSYYYADSAHPVGTFDARLSGKHLAILLDLGSSFFCSVGLSAPSTALGFFSCGQYSPSSCLRHELLVLLLSSALLLSIFFQ